MTESEAIERIKKDICNGNPNCICRDACMYGKGKCAYEMAVIALEEVKQYRAIGTVSEFRELKEKATAKKPIETDWLRCPNCDVTLLLGEKHCICGQKLDWSEGKE